MKNEVCVSGYVGTNGECNDCGSLDCHLARPAKLTEEERRTLKDGGLLRGDEALRIIDQLTAALEAAEHDHREERESRKYWEQEESKTWARAEALQARVTELEAQQAGFQLRFDGPPGPEGPRFIESETLDGKGVSLGDWEQDGDYWLLRVRVFRSNDAESELATAEARVAELEAELSRTDAAGVANTRAWRAAESELADLRGRVARAEEWLTSAWISNAKRVSLAWEALRGR